MNTPNKLTMLRVILVPVFMGVMLIGTTVAKVVALAIFIIASATDSIDGYIARKYNLVTNFGKFMDPLADKLLVTAGILVFVAWNQMPAWAAMIVLAREFAVTGLRLVAASGGLVIAAGWSGKVKTAATVVCICIMLTPLHLFEIIPGFFTLNDLCVWVILLTTIYSGAEYFVKNIRVIDMSK